MTQLQLMAYLFLVQAFFKIQYIFMKRPTFGGFKLVSKLKSSK